MKAPSITILFCCAAFLQAEAAVVTVTSQSNFTFRGDTTYYVTNAVTLSGVTTFEGGTVIKYASGASLSVTSVNWQTTSYHPAILTAKDDNSVGASISGSTGNPSGYYANPALSFSGSPPSTWEMANFRIAYAQQAIIANCVSFTLSLYDGQIVNCGNGINVPGQGDVYLENLLFAGVQTAFNNPSYVNFVGENVTFGGLTNYVPSFLISTYGSGSSPFSFYFRNCVFANYYSYIQGGTQGPSQTLNGDHNGFSSLSQTPPAPFGDPGTQTIASYGTAVFQTAGAGYYYLTASSVFHGPATTSNIDPYLLSDLTNKTTTAPAGPPTPQPSGTTWNQLVPRDTMVADLGYHYDPLDYFIKQYGVSGAPNTLNNGVSVGMYGSSGFVMQGGGGITVNGLPSQISHICWYPSVQEEPILLNNVSTAGSVVFGIASVPNSPKIITLHFSDLSMQGEDQSFFDIGAAYYFPIVQLRDCQLREVALNVQNYYPGGSPGSSISLINNLLERCSASFFNGYGLYYYGSNQYFVFQNPLTLTLYNNLFWQSGLGLTYDAAQQQYAMGWTIKDNLFDSDSVSFSGDGSYASDISKSNNGNNDTTMPSQLTDPATDVSLTALTYAIGPLGDRYIGFSSPTLIDAGSRTAAAAGLSGETILSSQIPDTCTVDIGFHYEVIGDNGELAGNTNLVVSTNITPLEMAQVLVGPGVTVQNATYNGALGARGIFANGTLCNFPINSGILLASGSIDNAIGPNNSSSTTTAYGLPGDPDLDNLTGGGPTADAAVLQFDLISTNSFTLQFHYIFGSEEYPEFIGHFNDPMAIYVTPNSTNSIADDIAMVPGTDLPVSVNNINGGCVSDAYGFSDPATNPQYYVDNHDPGFSALAPYSASAPVYNLQYDGFTTLLTAQSNITANVTYHVKIAIADFSDDYYDSGVFLQPLSACQ